MGMLRFSCHLQAILNPQSERDHPLRLGGNAPISPNKEAVSIAKQPLCPIFYESSLFNCVNLSGFSVSSQLNSIKSFSSN